MSSGLEDFSLFELFRMEAEEQIRVLQTELLALESSAASAKNLESLMRAAHSLKGAARIIGLDVIVQLTHVMEDRFVAAQAGRALEAGDIDRMLAATDWLARLQAVTEAETAGWLATNTEAIVAFTGTISARSTVRSGVRSGVRSQVAEAVALPAAKPAPAPPPVEQEPVAAKPEQDTFGSAHDAHEAGRERTVRIAADRFDQILSLTSETLVSSRKLATQGDVLERNRRAILRAAHLLEDEATTAAERGAALKEIDRQAASLAAHIGELDLIARAAELTSERLYRAVLAGRLRPFSDGIGGVARLVRDTARELGKVVRLEVLGENTRVDRDILERLEAPISHLISNAIDHGIEAPAERMAAGKAAEAHLRLHARHENGRLVITVRDDGRGIQRDELRARTIHQHLLTQETAAGMADSELLEFLFLPGFSTRESVSTVSGRGVGLNVVQSMVQEAGGSVTVTSEPGTGTVFRLTLPVTRSVIKVIRLEVEGELYAVPLVRIDRVAHLELDAAASEEAPPTVTSDGEALPVLSLAALLGFSHRPLPHGAIPMLLCGGVAFAVDRFVDEVELPVRRLDRRLGKVPGVSAASLDENGLPVLILDVEDLIQTAKGHAHAPSVESLTGAPHILIVDDSHTVREIMRRILAGAGYTLTTAQNGQEAWNLLRLNEYDLLISDVDMPQMNGIELVTRLRESPRLGHMPVILLSYKDREEDRRRGLDAGADFYLTKGDFENESFRQVVVDLIGPGEPMAGSQAVA